MKEQYHILNGDAFKNQFPETIHGRKIVCRECLVDGSVEGYELNELYKTRVKFLNDNYGECSEEDYFRKTVTEFKEIQNIPQGSEINLWFEDDLFCQVNFWFIINLISKNHQNNNVFLIGPKINCEYSFGKMNKQDLISAFQKKIKIESLEIKELSKLWKLYQKNNCNEMIIIAEKLKDKFHFLIPAIKAHKDRLIRNGNLGRPTQSLLQIMNELKTVEFGPIFREFCKREEIYGFGDLQVKRLFEEIKNKH